MNSNNALKTVDKKKMAQAGFKAAERIMDGWGCSSKEKQKIMRVAASTYHKYKTKPDSILLDDHQLARLSYVINIHSSLRIIFDNQENVKGFMTMQNDNPYFNGRSPLSIIRDGQLSHLYEVCCRIDALRLGL